MLRSQAGWEAIKGEASGDWSFPVVGACKKLLSSTGGG